MAHVQPADGYMGVFRFGEFTFDCGSRRLMRDGREQHLSPKAQLLLRLLLLAYPRALSREELYAALWPDTFVSETNLAGIVNEVRRALDDDARTAQYIRTVHGFGYAFCGDVQASQRRTSANAVLLCEGQTHTLQEGENVIGRAADARVVLTHASVSRRHARIIVHGDEIWIEDLGSRNGTFVDGQRIERARIHRKQRIELGGVSARLLLMSSSTSSLRIDVAEVKRRIAKAPTA